MKLVIPQETLDFLRAMREQRVLSDLAGNKLNYANGAILVACSDGDQMPDIWKIQTDICAGHRHDPRIHTIALNGGALLIPPHSPLSQTLHEDLVLLEHIKNGIIMKEIYTIAIYTHFPCGMATQASVDVRKQIQLLIDAKNLIKLTCPDTKVSCFVQIAWPDSDEKEKRKRTYYMSRKKWQKFNS